MKVRGRALPWLIGSSAAELGLAVWQWVELESLRRGGDSPFCAVSSKVSCEAVWMSPLAVRATELLGLPVAALGVIWGLTATFLALMLWARARSGKGTDGMVAANRITAVAGGLSVVVFIAGSVHAGAVCLTCLGTYALVTAYAALAFACAQPRVQRGAALWTGAAWAGLTAAVVFGVVRFQASMMGSGTATSAEEILRLARPAAMAQASPNEAVAALLRQLTTPQAQLVARGRQLYLEAPAVGYADAPRDRWGPADAPLRIVEFADLRCSHCRELTGALAAMKRVVPPGRFSLESRHFPLDSECNPALTQSDKTGVHCLGAKVQICSEGTPNYWDVVEGLFGAQPGLTKATTLEVAKAKSHAPDALEACLERPETARKLQADIDYAQHFSPRGTPIVLLNGKYVPVASPLFIYAMALAGGRADLPAFDALPAPRASQ